MTTKPKSVPKETKPKAAKNVTAEVAAEAPETSGQESPETLSPEEKVDQAKEASRERRNPFHKKAKEVFETHNVDEVHFTTDGTAFIHKQHARMHAENIKDSVIHTIKREEV